MIPFSRGGGVFIGHFDMAKLRRFYLNQDTVWVMCVSVVWRSMEARLIFHHKTFQPSGMNIDFAFLW